jgi:hypothetical protein
MAKNWAIAIGINQYDNLKSLKYAKGDAEAMKAWCEQEGGFEPQGLFLFTEDSPPFLLAPPFPLSLPMPVSCGFSRSSSRLLCFSLETTSGFSLLVMAGATKTKTI